MCNIEENHQQSIEEQHAELGLCTNQILHWSFGFLTPSSTRKEDMYQLSVIWEYSLIAHQLHIGTQSQLLLSRSDFNPETSFGIPSLN